MTVPYTIDFSWDDTDTFVARLTDKPIIIDLSRYVITGRTGQATVETVIGPDGAPETEWSTPVAVGSVKRRSWLSRAWRRVKRSHYSPRP